MNSNYASTLDGRNEHTVYVRRSYMYEFIILFVISVIVLTITIRNLTSDTVTTGGYVICCIILILFVISAVMYAGNLFGGPFNSPISPAAPVSSGLNEGPVIRIRYV
jgi:cell division protein FtsW (lipid II flippase)